jgi:DNA-directed RNA polymerase subunit alpha
MEAIPLPNRPVIVPSGENKYTLTLEPLYPGYGVTIGNTLRRVLLSSLPGTAVTAVKIKFADHEFSTIPNIKEDVIQIILNLKQLKLKSFSPEPVKLQLKVKGEKAVTAGDIQETDQVQIINKDLHIATIDSKNGELDMELTVEQGRGYVPVEARENEKLEVGVLAVDAIYTPIKSVFFDVTNVRVGQMTNFDKLSVTMETDGTMDGTEAFDIASHILVDHFSMLFGDGLQTKSEEAGEVVATEGMFDEEADEEITETSEESDLDTVSLSNRAKNALIKNGIVTVARLRELSDDDINNIPGLGKKTITEILTLLGRE